MGLTVEEYGARFFSQGASMTGVIEHPGNPGKDQARMLRDMFRKSHSGVKNSHALGVLTGGAKWVNVAHTPEQGQFLETRRFQLLEVARFYRVPPHLVDPTVTSTWGTGIVEQNEWVIVQTLGPWMKRLEDALSSLLPNGTFIKFNADSRLRAKTKDRYDAYAVALSNGFMTVDEVRALEDMEPLAQAA